MAHEWFKPRGYSHLDAPVGLPFAARAGDKSFAAQHDWSVLIRYFKEVKRYKPLIGTTVLKRRPIMYASHRDACILSRYAHDLTALLDAHYAETMIDANVIAYRKLGRTNYQFAAAAHQFARAHSPCVVMCFDVTGFFDHLDHAILKANLKQMLKVSQLSDDWHAVFRHVSRFKFIEREALEGNATFAARLEEPSHAPFATIKQVKEAGIAIRKNEQSFGIPQGTPISAVFSNLYMLEFDHALADACAQVGAFYQRYSDDILVACPPQHQGMLSALVEATLAKLKLTLSADKTEIMTFAAGNAESFQYLGFDMAPTGATLRASSLSRQWRKLKRSIRRTQKAGELAIAAGNATKVFTKKLRKRFSNVGARNFSSYARNAATALDSKKIVSQARRLERAADKAIRDLNK